MEWKLKENVEPQGSSDGFHYDLFNGGRIRPKEILADEKQLVELSKAISLINSFESMMEENELINEF